MQKFVHLILSHKSCELSSLFFILIYLFFSDFTISNDLYSSSEAFFFCLIKPAVEAIKFFISLIECFSYTISFWFFCMISIYLLNFSCPSWLVFLFLLKCLSVFSCISLSFLKIIICHSFYENSSLWYVESYCILLVLSYILAFPCVLCPYINVCALVEQLPLSNFAEWLS